MADFSRQGPTHHFTEPRGNDRDDPEKRKAVHGLFTTLMADAAQQGYAEYRTHLSYMDAGAGTYGFNDAALRRLNENFKNALDLNGILAPGQKRHLAEAIRRRKILSRLIRIGPAIGGFMLLGWCAVQAQNVPASATPEQLFQAKCGTCHLVGGMGTSLLTRRVGQEKSLLAERRDLTSDYIKLVARNGLINMPRLSRAEVTDAELAAIATYLTRSTRGETDRG